MAGNKDNAASGKALGPRQIKALAALFKYPTQKQAAAAAGISEDTIVLWRRNPVFQAELDRMRSEILDSTARYVIGLRTEALEALEKLLTHRTAKIRLDTARVILLTTMPTVTAADEQAQIDELKAKLEAYRNSSDSADGGDGDLDDEETYSSAA